MAGDLRYGSMTRRHMLLGATAIAVNALAVACGSGSSATNTQTPVPATTAPPIPATASLSVPPVPETFATPTGTPTTPLIIFVGASTVYGVGVQRTENMPAQTIALLAPAKYDAVNLGMSGGVTLAELIPRAPQTIDPLYAASRSKNIVVLGGTNDLGGGASVEEAFARMVMFCQARRSAGFKVVVLTFLPNSVPLSGGRDREAEQQRYNALMRTKLTSFADALADVGADPMVGVAGANENREYFQADGSHPTAKAYSIIAGIVKAAILTL